MQELSIAQSLFELIETQLAAAEEPLFAFRRAKRSGLRNRKRRACGSRMTVIDARIVTEAAHVG